MLFYLFKSARKAARAAVHRAQTEWFEKMAAEVEMARFDGARVWKHICHLQRACRGLEPVKVTTIKDEHGVVFLTESAHQECLNRHFSNILNVPSELSYSILDSLPQREVQHDLDARPSLEEVSKAIGQLSNGKAAGASLVVAELTKTGGSVFANALLVLLDSVWEEECVPQDWVNSILVPFQRRVTYRLVTIGAVLLC